jgi:hypothetical protein
MKLHQFIVDVGRASRVMDATGRTSPLIIDVPVRVGQPDTADEDETVVVALPLAADQAASGARLLRTIPDGRMIIALVNEAPDELPVGTLVDLLVDGGVQATHALPIIDGEFRTAVAGWRSSGTIASVAPYLDARRQVPLAEGAALLRVLAEHVIEGVAGRVREAAARNDVARLEREREEARMLAEATHQRMALLETANRQQEAEARARLTAIEKRLQRILNSKSYRFARLLSAPVRALKGSTSPDR